MSTRREFIKGSTLTAVLAGLGIVPDIPAEEIEPVEELAIEVSSPEPTTVVLPGPGWWNNPSGIQSYMIMGGMEPIPVVGLAISSRREGPSWYGGYPMDFALTVGASPLSIINEIFNHINPLDSHISIHTKQDDHLITLPCCIITEMEYDGDLSLKVWGVADEAVITHWR